MIDEGIVKSIYGRIGDELSRRIFTDRLMYSLTGDRSFLLDCIVTSEAGAEFLDVLHEWKKRGSPLCVYGAGGLGRAFYDAHSDQIDFFVDRNHEKIHVGDVPVLPPGVLREHTSAFVYIAIGPAYKDEIQLIIDNLCAWGFKKEQIYAPYWVHPELLDEVYFDLPQLKWETDSCFLDVGSFDGYNSIQYLNRHKARFPSGTPEIIAFEPSSKLAKQTIEVLGRESGISFQVVQQGVWDRCGVVRADITAAGTFCENENGAIEMDCTTIDNILQGKPVSLIKMDIEGAEHKALKGAENTIRACKPQLAISIYHKPEDIIELPQLLMDLNPEYIFYLRHYSLDMADTVLYAISG